MLTSKQIFSLLFLALLCFVSSSSVLAQRKHSCGATEINEKLRKNGKLPQKEAFERWISQHIQGLQTARTEDGTERYIVPIVYHILHTGQPIGTGYNISYAQVLSQHKVINEDFNRTNADSVLTPTIFRNRAANFGIEFRLAETDPQGNRLAEPGVVRHNIAGLGFDATALLSEDIDKKIAPSRVFPPNFAINQFVVPSAAFPPDEPGGNPTVLYGYATFPGDSGNGGDTGDTSGVPLSVTVAHAFGSVRDGILGLDENANRGRTTTHELGHYFALFHIWGDENECEADDYCNDTPKQAKSNQGLGECGAIKLSCDGVTPEMLQNYMDYSNDECMNIFTNDQKKRFLAVMRNSKTRKDLPLSEAIKPHAAPSNLTVTARISTSLEIRWRDNATNESGFILERSADGQTFAEVNKPAANSTIFTDNGLADAKKYFYRIKATNRAGETTYSNIGEGTTESTPLSIENDQIAQALQISPNPSKGSFLVSLQLPYSSEIKMTVTDLTGRVIGQWKSAKTTSLQQQVELSQYPQGLYLMHIQTEKGYSTQKIAIQK
jgi:hypothetical protein